MVIILTNVLVLFIDSKVEVEEEYTHKPTTTTMGFALACRGKVNCIKLLFDAAQILMSVSFPQRRVSVQKMADSQIDTNKGQINPGGGGGITCAVISQMVNSIMYISTASVEQYSRIILHH